MKKNQRTIGKPVELEGVGLFGGQSGKVRLLPAPANSGITFVRTDLEARPRLPVSPDTVASKFRRSAVSGENAEVETIEHLMSACAGLELDNLDVEVNVPELPNIDGSSQPWVDLIRKAGLVDLPDPRRIHVVREAIAVSDNEASIVALPNEGGLSVSYTLNYPNTAIGQQHFTLEMTDENYAALISPARTFCLQSEAEALVAQGLGKGGSYQTTVVWGPKGPIENTPRFADEPVRHKILDLMGDLATLGAGLRAHVVAVKSGHTTNMKLVRKIASLFTEAGQLPSKPGGTLLDVREIAKILPHRYPFLLIDKVVELDGYRRAVGIKNVSFNEPFFQGHFPGQPIMPGVLQIEAMAQLAGVLLMRKSDNQAKVAVLLSLDGVKLRKSVVPGDQLRIEVETLKVKPRTGEVIARATVDGQLVAEANMKFMLMDGQ
ncbi:MAG TPA: UDP-3-O-acyl-N-acetylglucosamine deacetylase [Planctomycetota bacterium]|nr:UDP-3-O-acyl-N-acetylglucosamine deacetylase [Planctomycetota bacterium]